MDQRIISAVSGVVIAGVAAFATANPYAGTITEDAGNVTFRLNEAADEVIILRDGTPQSLGGLGVGSHTFARSGASVYQIVVRKSAGDGYQTAIAPNFAGLLQISDDGNTRNNFDRGVGMAINRNPATPALFGRTYIASPQNFVTALGRSVTDGIYINNPDGSDAVGQGDNGLTGGLDFVTGGATSPWRIALDDDGFLYIADWSDATGTVYRVEPDVGSSGGFNLLTGQGGPAPAAPTATNNHGSVGGLAVTGSISQGNLTLYTIDEDLDPDGEGPPTSPWELNSLWRYNIGAGPTPTNQIPDHLASQVLISDFTPGGIIVDLARGPDGKFYMSQNRSVGSETGVGVIARDGVTQVFDSLQDSVDRGLDTVDVLRLTRNVAVSPDGRWLATGTALGGDFVMVPLLAGIPDLPNRLVLDAFFGSTNDAVGFDAAGNVSGVNRIEELLRTFSPGGLSVTAYGSDGTFVMDPSYTAGAGNYSTSSSWLAGVVPNGANQVARFGGAGGNVNMDSAVTVGAIKFDSASSYTLGGSNTITLQGGSPNVMSQQGSHTIAAPLLLTQSSGFVADGGTLRIENLNLSTSPVNPIELYTGGTGVVELNNASAQRLYVVDGTTRIIANGTAAATSTVKRLTIAGDVTPIAKLDLTNNAFVVDYDPPAAGPDAEPFDTIAAQVASAYNGGAWDGNGIGSSLANASSHGIGLAEASALASVPAIFGSVDSTAVLLRYTRYGDANLDGTVNLADFNSLAGNFGSTTATWNQGDFNYDGLVNLADFNRLAANFGLQAGPDGPTPEDWSNLAAAVPEPASLSLVGVGALMAMRRRRR